jgi:hypothetical protein
MKHLYFKTEKAFLEHSSLNLMNIFDSACPKGREVKSAIGYELQENNIYSNANSVRTFLCPECYSSASIEERGEL